MKPRNDTSVLKCLKESKQTIYICYKFGGENTRTPIGLSPSRAFLFWTVRNPSVEREEHGEVVSVQQPTFTCICTSSLGTPDYP